MDLSYSNQNKIILTSKRKEEVLFDSFSNIKRIEAYRPLTFLFNSSECFKLNNYECKSLSLRKTIGIRKDLLALGFSMDMLQRLVENEDSSKKDIQNKILSFLNKSENKNLEISRLDELEILSLFFD